MPKIRLKMLLSLEALFAGTYIALTRGILFVYLVSIGAGLNGISVVVGLSAFATTIVHILLYKHPKILVTRVWMKFTILHALERILFVLIPFLDEPFLISIVFGLINCLPTGTFMNLVIYGSLSKDEIKDVTAKRMAAFNVSSAGGFVLAMMLMAFLPSESKFVYSYVIGSAIGLFSTFAVALMKLSHLEGIPIPRGFDQPAKLFSTSSYFVILLASGNLLLMVWVPYVMEFLGAPDYMAVAMNLAGMLATVAGSFFWRGRSFKILRSGAAADVLPAGVASLIHVASVHPLLSAVSSFTYTGANFIGNFLFAGYNRWLGAIRSSILLIIIMSVSQVIIAPVSSVLAGNYFLIFVVIVVLKLIAVILALLAIPEVAVVGEEDARVYSYALYNNSLSGYRISVEVSRDTIVLTLRLIGLAAVLFMLYVIYRIVYLLI